MTVQGTAGLAAGLVVVFFGVVVVFLGVLVVGFGALLTLLGGGAVVMVVVGAAELVEIGVPAAASGCTAVLSVPPEQPASATAAAAPLNATQILFTRTLPPRVGSVGCYID
ncbi:hypothetical protein [Amycolatopsis acidiphila]|uniref:hypothetical protein n=1 Tax=Amycolatopsis acidiphila TaxID=715473 RepID=UPI0027E54DE5|nr:hypothetical protein [Amycolatopsis acidiphila]